MTITFILWGWTNQWGWDGRGCSMHGKYEKCI